MIQHTEHILEDFSKHLNSRLILTDFIAALPLFQEIVDKKNDNGLKHAVLLPCEQNTFRQLCDFGYPELLQKIIPKFDIIAEAEDVYCSKFERLTFEVLRDTFVEEIKKVQVVSNSSLERFQIECSKLVVELIWGPISQLHGETVLQLQYFERIIELKSRTSSRADAVKSIYLNSKTPTPYSYFILAFLAENLGIPLKL